MSLRGAGATARVVCCKHARQNGVNTLNGSSALVRIVHGSNISAPFELSTLTPAFLSAALIFSSRVRADGSYKRFQYTAPAPLSRTMAVQPWRRRHGEG